MLRCSEVTRLCASEELDHASWWKRLAVRFHLKVCTSCRRYVRELRLIGAAAQDVTADSPEDAARRESLVQRVLAKEPRAD